MTTLGPTPDNLKQTARNRFKQALKALAGIEDKHVVEIELGESATAVMNRFADIALVKELATLIERDPEISPLVRGLLPGMVDSRSCRDDTTALSTTAEGSLQNDAHGSQMNELVSVDNETVRRLLDVLSRFDQ